MAVVEKMTNAELAHALRIADERGDETIELVVEVAYRIGLGPDETEQGPTEKAVREIDAFIDRHDPVR
jgi:myo-inositol catabolism protein IolC